MGYRTPLAPQKGRLTTQPASSQRWDLVMEYGAAGSGRLPVTQYKQVGSNPIGTASVGERKTQMVL